MGLSARVPPCSIGIEFEGQSRFLFGHWQNYLFGELENAALIKKMKA